MVRLNVHSPTIEEAEHDLLQAAKLREGFSLLQETQTWWEVSLSTSTEDVEDSMSNYRKGEHVVHFLAKFWGFISRVEVDEITITDESKCVEWLESGLALCAFWVSPLQSLKFGTSIACSHCRSRGSTLGSHCEAPFHGARVCPDTTTTQALARAAVGSLHRRAVRRRSMNSRNRISHKKQTSSLTS